jgi:hypothetical protein
MTSSTLGPEFLALEASRVSRQVCYAYRPCSTFFYSHIVIKSDSIEKGKQHRDFFTIPEFVGSDLMQGSGLLNLNVIL